ncbi:putative protein N(5)-glutamine methyltransferase [Kitasatospora sp. LaBMicrA B282]|uniref:putative protein N(5)-glutamine methyltransferase n=1 Tax=Kitasatospora sp. LaBMicrA B282 TaxID=3420949 RepID=UPI003D127593
MALPSHVSHPARTIVDRLRAAGCVFAEDEADLITATATSTEQLADMVERRVLGFPLEYVVGWADFRGLRISVDPGVFVPRRRTEFLVTCAAALTDPNAVVVDLGCGSGALGAALAAAVYRTGCRLELHAADVDPAAVTCARRNLPPGGRAYQGDLFAPLPDRLRGRVATLLANMPYVPTADLALLPAEARDHEALVALDGGADGLAVLRRVAEQAPSWLAPGGHLLFETGEHQVPYALEVVASAGLSARVRTDDELDATVVIATRR